MSTPICTYKGRERDYKAVIKVILKQSWDFFSFFLGKGTETKKIVYFKFWTILQHTYKKKCLLYIIMHILFKIAIACTIFNIQMYTEYTTLYTSI